MPHHPVFCIFHDFGMILSRLCQENSSNIKDFSFPQFSLSLSLLFYLFIFYFYGVNELNCL